MVEKYYNDKGEVAVLYSPGYGAGWSTWCSDECKEFMLFDKKLVEFVLEDAPFNKVQTYIEEKFQKHAPYLGGWGTIAIEWMSPGTRFIIDEYDGSERVEYLGNINFFIA